MSAPSLSEAAVESRVAEGVARTGSRAPAPVRPRAFRRNSLVGWFAAVLVLLGLSNRGLGDYQVNLASDGKSAISLAPGQTFPLDVEVDGAVNEVIDSAELRLRFSVSGLVLQSCAWSAPYVTGGLDDASLPPASALPLTVSAGTLDSPAFPSADIDLYFSNLAAGSAKSGPGRILRLTLKVPADHVGPETISIEPLPILFTLGFTEVKATAGGLFRVTINRGIGAPNLPQPRGARQINGNLYVFGNDSAEDGDGIEVEPGVSAGQYKVTFRSGTDTNFVTVGGVTNRIIVYGQTGNDDLRISDVVALNTELYGGPGDDVLKGGAGNDFLSGEEGKDFVVSSAGLDTFTGGPGQDGVVFYGTPGNDTILVSWYLIKDGQDPGVVVHPPFPPHHDGLRVFINGVPHEMDYTPQDDLETIVVYGGAGDDHIEMLDDAAAQHWNAEFHGEDGNDVLIGSRNLSDKDRGNDLLLGGPGDDQLFGYSGQDVLVGGPGSDSIDAGQGVNRVVTDGTDEIRINGADTVEMVATYPGARSASVDWGDGTREAAQVDPGSGQVTGSHQYRVLAAGSVRITVVTHDAEDAVTTHVLSAAVASLPLNHVPGALRIARRSGGRLRTTFPGVPGFTYILQASDGVSADGMWDEIAEAICGLEGIATFDLPDPTRQKAQFFRAVAKVDMTTEHAH